jgi:WD40 repeat protein
MTRIFISYSRRDKAVADYIGAELRNRGTDVFIDYQKLIGGENFIGRLGREIEARDFFVLLLSPRSVASKWVQAEAAWALRCDKPIVPVLLEPASMADFFFLTNVEYVDFTGWYVDGEVGEAVRKLAAALRLPTEPIRAEPVPEPLVQAAPSEDEAEDKVEAMSAPAFARGDLSELFNTAAEVARQDPEQAIFLYRRILEIDPEYMQGRARDFARREEERLKPTRLARMLAQAEAAMQAGEWSRAERIGRDMLGLDANNPDAQRIVAVCAQNAACEPIYQQAVSAAGAGRWQTVDTLMRDIIEINPDYGDPAGLLRRFPISKDLLRKFSIPRAIRLGLINHLRELATLTGHMASVSFVAFSPDGTLLASASKDGVKLWDMPGGHELSTLTQGHSDFVTLAFSPDSAWLASASRDGTIELWKMPGGYRLPILDEPRGSVYSVAFSPDGTLLAFVSRQETAKHDKTTELNETLDLWKMGTRPRMWRFVTTLADDSWIGFPMAFSADGTLLAYISGGRTIKLLEMLWRRELATLTGHSDFVTFVAFSPDGSLLASASEDETIKLWGIPDGQKLATLTGHSLVKEKEKMGFFDRLFGPPPPKNVVFFVTFSPDGSLLASASKDGTIKLWETPDGRELATLTGHSGAVRSVAFSPDGSLLASASHDETIKLWGLG